MNVSNLSDIDCPQYVCFDSEDFQRNLCETSTVSKDSLNVSDHSDDTEELLMISGSLSTSQSMQSCISVQDDKTQYLEESLHCDYEETSNTDKENLRNFSNQNENFPIQRPKNLAGKMKRSVLKTTVPKPFQFKTDDRIKSKPTKEGLSYEKKEFSSELRKNIVLQPHKNHVTKHQPFNLTEAKKRKREADYLPLAEQVSAFHKKTPERYHTSSHKGFQPQEHWNPPNIVAKSPKLQAIKRRRVVQTLSKEEQEEKEIEEMKAYEFHARPVDPKIYNQPCTSKAQPMIKTQHKSFRLKTTQRAVMQLRNRKKSTKEKYQFKARPVPKAILSGPTGLKEKPMIRITEPKAPAFEVENRLEKRKIHEQEKKVKEEAQKKKEASKQHLASVPTVPSIPYTKKRTEIQPFSFDKMDKERFSQKEKKIQEEIEKESQPYLFHAQPMPFPEPSSLPAVPKKPPTQLEPFNFLLDNRNFKHSTVSISFEENTSFKAQPATVLNKEPFIPEKPPKQTIEIKEFNLYTDKRACERQQLKEVKDIEEFQKQQALLQQRALEEERERQELVKHRREIVHKANPVRQYKPVEIKPSSMPLTQPESPKFETDKRLQTRHDETKEFNHYTDKRASERQLKEVKDVEEFQKQQALLQQRALEEEKKHQELVKYRREIVHKANPVRQYKSVEIKPSSIPLTRPESPKFETDKRLQTRHDETKEFNLCTDKRASERQQSTEIKDIEEFLKQQAVLQQKALEEEKQRQELIKQRNRL